ncbi:MAG: efflux RND transporter periplasmic adaptor subunit [Bacteroidales bacterium]|nr:efflux RND transporter periplasmic adaptor subunit [Bacteroidales bacterium]
MKRSIILYLLAVLIIGAAAYKIIKDRRKNNVTKTVVAAPVFPAEGYLVKDTLVNYELQTIGTIRANESVHIVSEISKRLIFINFSEGTFVSKGTLLFKLDDADLKAHLEKFTLMEALAMQNEQRNKTLLEKGGISQGVYDEVLNNLKTIQADIHLIQVELDKTEIRAPFSGMIGLRNVSDGAFITPDMVLTRLQDVSKVRIDFSIPERYANSIKQGLTISFTLPANPEVFTATIKASQPNIDVTTRNLKIMAMTDNSSGLILPGSSVKVSLQFEESKKSIFVPSQCLVPSLKGYNVYVVSEGKAILREVIVGRRTNMSVQLLDGTKPGDTLIMTNQLRIRPGSKVEIIKII